MYVATSTGPAVRSGLLISTSFSNKKAAQLGTMCGLRYVVCHGRTTTLCDIQWKHCLMLHCVCLPFRLKRRLQIAGTILGGGGVIGGEGGEG